VGFKLILLRIMVKTVVLIGSGNSAHVVAGLVHENTKGAWQVVMLTRNPQLFTSKTVKVALQDGTSRTGLISKVTSKPAEAVPGADLVVWTGPVSSTKSVFEWIAPSVGANTVVSTIFGQGLSHILAARVFGSAVKFVALRNIPWLCRCTEKGVSSEIVGAKTSIEVASLNVNQQWITENMQPLFWTPKGPVLNLEPDFCSIVFNPANQIIHPAVYWGLFRSWNGVDPMKALPNDGWLYRGMDAVAGGVLQALDEELQAVKNAFFDKTNMQGCKSVLPIKTRILKQYTDQVKDASSMHGVVGTNVAYSMAKTPHVKVAGGVMPAPNHRVVQDDIGWGLCVLVSIGDRLKVPTTTMKWLIQWHQTFMKKDFIRDGKLVGKDCAELILLAENEPLELVGGLAGKAKL